MRARGLRTVRGMTGDVLGTSPRPPRTRAGTLQVALLLAASAVLSAGAAYESAIALGWIALGDIPGEDASGRGVVLAAALTALLIGSSILAVGSPGITGAAALTELAATGFVVARFLSFDPYYAPTLRRMSDGGLVPSSWLVAVVAAALAAVVLLRLRPRAGLIVGAGVLLLCALTAVAESGGH